MGVCYLFLKEEGRRIGREERDRLKTEGQTDRQTKKLSVGLELTT